MSGAGSAGARPGDVGRCAPDGRASPGASRRAAGVGDCLRGSSEAPSVRAFADRCTLTRSARSSPSSALLHHGRRRRPAPLNERRRQTRSTIDARPAPWPAARQLARRRVGRRRRASPAGCAGRGRPARRSTRGCSLRQGIAWNSPAAGREEAPASPRCRSPPASRGSRRRSPGRRRRRAARPPSRARRAFGRCRASATRRVPKRDWNVTTNCSGSSPSSVASSRAVLWQWQWYGSPRSSARRGSAVEAQHQLVRPAVLHPVVVDALRERPDVARIVVKAVDRAQRRHPAHALRAARRPRRAPRPSCSPRTADRAARRGCGRSRRSRSRSIASAIVGIAVAHRRARPRTGPTAGPASFSRWPR